MKYLQLIILLVLTIFLATPAIAGQGRHGDSYYAYSSYGDRVDRHLDRKGDQIQHRFEHKAMRAESKGKYHKADRMRAKGERINRHLDRKGNRIHAAYDRRHSPQYRHHYKAPRVIYRSPILYDSYFGVVINQPGLTIGWGWYD